MTRRAGRPDVLLTILLTLAASGAVVCAQEVSPTFPGGTEVVILVFGRLGMQAAGSAREAALDFAQREFPLGTLNVSRPLGVLQFDYDQPGRRYHAHFAVLAVLRDRDGKVITRLSHDWPLAGPLMEAPGVRNQSATVKRTLELAPGAYTVESAVADRLGGGLSVMSTPVEVPGGEPVVSP